MTGKMWVTISIDEMLQLVYQPLTAKDPAEKWYAFSIYNQGEGK